MRGQLNTATVLVHAIRIIPARAGPTAVAIVVDKIIPDHPRSCGANVGRGSEFRTGGGSSPLVRGQLNRILLAHNTTRIIPARAGPTEGTHEKDHRTADHPRSCGANVGPEGANHDQFGSSPLVRGQRRYGFDAGFLTRIIPARAGPTPSSPEARSRRSDHPRSCGANQYVDLISCLGHGSSPLVRGQRVRPVLGRT